MAIEKKSILARIQASVDKVSAKDTKKRNTMLNAVREALKDFPVEFVESGKRHLIAYNDAKIGVVTTVCEACAVTADGKVGYVKVSVKEMTEYVKELIARDKAEAKK